ncbi:hypothetical protein [Dyella sp.]|uniref:hypothetical protein n=1 Tax=Dyella sp. TaxID=1869338 RepID=UPI002ECFE7C5
MASLVVLFPFSLLLYFLALFAFFNKNIFVGALFFTAGLGSIFRLVYEMTMCVEMDGRLIKRTWKFGKKIVIFDDIYRISWGGGRGILILSIHYKNNRSIQFGSDEIEKSGLHYIYEHIMASLELDGEDPWPRMVNYVNVKEMIKRKNAHMNEN